MQENFGIAVLEAASSGCPVAVSDQVYISDMFPSPREVLPLELDAWVTFFRERMPNQEWRLTIQEAQNRALPQFEMESVAAGWSETIRAVFGNSHDRREQMG
jgi:glycosyltransferase involved in cell wall biosynthesis